MIYLNVMFKPVFSISVTYLHLTMKHCTGLLMDGCITVCVEQAVCHDVRCVLNSTEGSVSHHDVPF